MAWWDKYTDQGAAPNAAPAGQSPAGAPPAAAAPAANWWDKYADQSATGGTVPGLGAALAYGESRANPPSTWDTIGKALVAPGVPSGAPSGRPPPAETPTVQFDLPSAVQGLLEMENAADPAIGGRYLHGAVPVEMDPERQSRVDRLKQLGWASVLNQTDEGLWDSIRAIYPDAELYHDTIPNPDFPDDPTKATHNPIVVVNGQGFYLNRPGVDATDVARYGPSAIAGIGIGGAAGGVARGLLPRMALVGAGEAGLSAALDKSAQWTGSEQPISGERMEWAAAGGAAGEGIGWLVGSLMRRFGSSAVRTTVNPATGQPTLQWSPEAQAAIQAMNIDPTALSQAWVAQFQKTANRTLLPDEAARLSDLTTLPEPIPYSRGDITRLPSDQMTEDLMRKGAFGEWAQRRFNTLRAGQNTALGANADAIGSQIAGGALGESGSGGALASYTLTRLRDAMKARTDALYTAARASEHGGIDIATGRGLAFDLGNGRRVPDLIAHAPRAQAMLAEFQDLLTRAGEGEVTIRAMMDWRRRLTTLASATRDDADAMALGDIRRTFDEKIQQMVDASMLSGDAASVQRWMDAIGSRREMGRLFEGDDLIERLTTMKQRGGGYELAVPPSQAANEIFGPAGLAAGDINLARDLTRLRDVLRGPPMLSAVAKEEGEAAWNALRGEAFDRLIRRAAGPYEDETARRAFSGAGLARAIDNVMQTNPQLMRVLFSAEELAQLEQLKRAALAVTTTARGGQNFSNTTPAAARLFSEILAGPFKKIGAALFGPNSWLGAVPYGVGPLTAGTVGGVRAGSRLGGGVVTQPMGIAGWLGGVTGTPLLTSQFEAELEALKARQAQSGQ